ncbi:MAG: sulfurtransferase-like selenium metabolism protein YedF [Anaerolineae bacterium]|jgi:selenium metabolism protein YedF
MTETIDARGLPCPQPVIKTRNAMEQSDEVVTIVDNETSQRNVTRMAEKSGATVKAEQGADGVYLRITRETGMAEAIAAGASAPASGGSLVLVVPSELLGRGEHDELGQILMRGFFHTLGEVQPLPDTMIFFNSGVKLVAEGSPVVEDLRALAEEGVEILACGTCLGYYGLKEDVAVGRVSNMYTIAETMVAAGRLVNL